MYRISYSLLRPHIETTYRITECCNDVRERTIKPCGSILNFHLRFKTARHRIQDKSQSLPPYQYGSAHRADDLSLPRIPIMFSTLKESYQGIQAYITLVEPIKRLEKKNRVISMKAMCFIVLPGPSTSFRSLSRVRVFLRGDALHRQRPSLLAQRFKIPSRGPWDHDRVTSCRVSVC